MPMTETRTESSHTNPPIAQQTNTGRCLFRRSDVRLRFVALVSLISAGVSPPEAGGTEYLVRTPSEISQAMQSAKPGDVLVMADGIWKDAAIAFNGNGTEAQPITLRAQTPGRAALTGRSSLYVSGSHLVVQDLRFALGSIPSGHVVEFKSGSHGCRLTGCAIVEYNPSNLYTNYKWVSLYGKQHRVDHCFFSGQRHIGVTLTVWLDGTANNDTVDHCYFGNRPLGWDNGFETIRIGTSDWSLTASRTTVEYNLFEKCDGEMEMVSNKSCDNVYRYNTFVSC